MKVQIERAALFRALAHVQSVVEKRNTLPILSNVLIEAADGALRLTATDLDMEITDSAPADVARAGSVTAPAGTLFDVVRKLPEGGDIALEFEGETGRLSMRCGRSRFALPTLPASDFQTMAREPAPVSFEIDRDALKRLIDRTRFAISTEETRFYLNGVYIHPTSEHGGRLRAVATDGHRLALSETPLPAGADAMEGVILPRKAVSELRRLLEDAPETVRIEASSSKLAFVLGAATLTTKLIDGSFPDYQRVIPKSNDRILKIDNRDFAAAVDRVATVSAERSKSVKMTLGEDRLMLAVNHADTGQGDEELAAEYASEALEIGFNARYLLDVAQQIEGGDAVFAFADAASPALVRDAEDDASLFVLMPLRV